MENILEVASTIFSIVGAFLISYKKRYGFYVLIFSTLGWSLFGIYNQFYGLLLTQIVFFIINIIGLKNWRVDD